MKLSEAGAGGAGLTLRSRTSRAAEKVPLPGRWVPHSPGWPTGTVPLRGRVARRAAGSLAFLGLESREFGVGIFPRREGKEQT